MNVSILICTYGETEWRNLAIRRALPSAQRQKDALEVMAMHDPDGDLAHCRNAAARAARGSFLCFLDGDDELAPGYIAACREVAAQRDSDALLFPWVQFVHRDHEEEPRSLETGRPLVELNRAVIGTLVPRELFLELGGFGDEPIYEDWALWLRCSEHLPMVEVPGAIYRAHVRAGSRNVNAASANAWYWRIRREHEARHHPIPRLVS